MSTIGSWIERVAAWFASQPQDVQIGIAMAFLLGFALSAIVTGVAG